MGGVLAGRLGPAVRGGGVIRPDGLGMGVRVAAGLLRLVVQLLCIRLMATIRVR